ncbi:MAG: Asp-tRNA(Asn)/Glu-tRNA(Gln) amidotransferase subunit GatC [Pseudomonadota bacterium]
MKIKPEQINKIAYLARLKIDKAEAASYANTLSEIFELVEQMNAIDTDGVEPLLHPIEVIQRLREDVVTEKNERKSFQKIAPETKDGLYLVPKVIE